MLAPMIASALAATSAHAAIVLGNGDSVNLGALLATGSDRTVIIDDKIFHFDSFTSSAFEVNKDIKFLAATGQGFATASFIRQEFSQVLAPSPGAVALVALAGVVVRRRQG